MVQLRAVASLLRVPGSLGGTGVSDCDPEAPPTEGIIHRRREEEEKKRDENIMMAN